MEWPLLDIPRALENADSSLNDILWYVEVLQGETEGHLPTPEDAALLLANIAALRELLREVIPPGLQKEIDAEKQYQEDEAGRWEPSNY